MPRALFSHIETWVFDLDRTLYPYSNVLFDQMGDRMRDWITDRLRVDPDHADHLRATYWREHGSTLNGLMAHHTIDPQDFLDYVHDVDFSLLIENPPLRAAIEALKGRKIIYTNGYVPYAQNAINALGLKGVFEKIYGTEHAGFVPKPYEAAFARVFELDGLTPSRAAMFEDDPHNLRVPYAMGLRTVHVAPTPEPADHIHHYTDDLSAFLQQLA